MGGSKKQTVGYRYSLGMHLALCHGPIDAIREILVDRRTAWSVTTGGGVSGGGAAVETRIGTVAGMAATAALAGDTGATITFPGTRAGVRIGRDYRLQLANGTSQTITLRGVTFNAGTNVTSWSVMPEALSFPAQAVEVFEATSAASNAGAGCAVAWPLRGPTGPSEYSMRGMPTRGTPSLVPTAGSPVTEPKGSSPASSEIFSASVISASSRRVRSAGLSEVSHQASFKHMDCALLPGAPGGGAPASPLSLPEQAASRPTSKPPQIKPPKRLIRLSSLKLLRPPRAPRRQGR